MQLHEESLAHNHNQTEISIYSGKLAGVREIAQELVKLKYAFPAMETNFISILSERLVANGFTEQRIKDAVANVIDNFTYKNPNIADIIKFDKKVKLYTYHEVSALVTEGASQFSDFEIYDQKRGLRIKIT